MYAWIYVDCIDFILKQEFTCTECPAHCAEYDSVKIQVSRAVGHRGKFGTALCGSS